MKSWLFTQKTIPSLGPLTVLLRLVMPEPKISFSNSSSSIRPKWIAPSLGHGHGPGVDQSKTCSS
jgi:hypothetical protein